MKAFSLFIDEKQNKIFFEKPNNKKQKQNKNKTKQNVNFPAPPFLKRRKFHGLVLGYVELIDVKGIGVAQPIWP